MHKIKSSGFTLLEMAIVMVIVGLLLIAMVEAWKQWDTRRYYYQVDTRLSTIDQALRKYVAVNGHLPCVASYTLPHNDPNHGRATDCAIPPALGTFSSPNPVRGNRAVRIGALPVRDLELSEDYYADPKGNVFTYAVTEVQAVNPINNSLGAIDIVDENNASLITPSGSALYVVANQGRQGEGAYYYGGGGLRLPCGAGMDGENCDDDHIFRKAPFSTFIGAPAFDDTIIYSTHLIPNCGVTGEVFDGSVCVPAMGTGKGGWTRNRDGSCRYPNAFTNQCVCPDAYNAIQVLQFDNPTCDPGFYADGWRTSNCGIQIYMCVKE